MKQTSAPIAKITPPKISGAVQRKRLFRLLDSGAEKSVVWLAAPAGSGKTTLVASWIEARNMPHLWYQLDAGDNDPATFFYYLGLAARKANPRKKKPLPLLTPEYLMNVPTFSRRFFEELGSRLTNSSNRSGSSNRLRNRFVLVFDNYQEVPTDSVLHDLLLQGFESLPEGAAAIVISRGAPAPLFTRLRANGRMAVIGWNELRFTLDEVKDAVKPLRRDHCLSRDCPGPDVLFEKTDGWAAGLRLMIEAVEPQRKIVRNTPPGEPVCHCVESLAWRDDVFSYFANEVMSRTEHSIRDFLLTTSLLPFTTPGIAEKLTGRKDTAAVLRDLSRRSFFTEWHPGRVPVYQYHFLFREFLQEQARRRFGDDERDRIRRTGAGLLEEAGFLEDAAGMYCSLGTFDRATALISRIARPLLEQGRSKAVEGLLTALPEKMLTADAGLLHLAGLCRIAVNPREARGFLESSFRLMKERDHAAAIPVCGAVLETIIYEGDNFKDFDPYIEWLDRVAGERERPVRDALQKISGTVLFALAYRSPDHRTLPLWLERAEKALTEASSAVETLKLCNHLMAYYLFRGEFNSITRVMMTTASWKKEAKAVPLLGLLCVLLESFHAVFVAGETDKGIALARKGLAWSRETGVQVYDFLLSYLIVSGSIVAGDLRTGEAFLQGMLLKGRNAPAKQTAELQSLAGNLALAKGDAHGAIEHFRTALDLDARAGDRFSVVWHKVCLAQAWYDCGDMRVARETLAEAARENWAHSLICRYKGLLTSTLIDLRERTREQGLRTLREALALGRQQNMMLAPFWDREITASLFAQALDAGIEREFVRQLIKKHRLTPPAGEIPAGESWPWPVRIYTLGGFQIFRNDVLLEFSGKTPQKPLELLKALIAFGGRSVPEERLADALWPDADGDLAHQSFMSNLSRLRRLLDEDDCIRYVGRVLSLDPQRCWVDSIALDAITSGMEDMPDGGRIARIYNEAVGLYKGHFLPADAGREWAVSGSETLKGRMLRVSEEAGRRYERDGLWESAVACYRKGLDIDSLAEEFYRRLMICYQKLGRRSDAVRLFNRCVALFREKLGIGPSAETEAVYSSLLQQL